MKFTANLNDIAIVPTVYNKKAYYKAIINGEEHSFIDEKEDVVILLAIGIAYDGVNSQFGTFATRMLGIDTPWKA